MTNVGRKALRFHIENTTGISSKPEPTFYLWEEKRKKRSFVRRLKAIVRLNIPKLRQSLSRISPVGYSKDLWR